MSDETARQVFKIRGMDCAEEVTVLKRELRPLVGDENRLAFDIIKGRMVGLERLNVEVDVRHKR